MRPTGSNSPRPLSTGRRGALTATAQSPATPARWRANSCRPSSTGKRASRTLPVRRVDERRSARPSMPRAAVHITVGIESVIGSKRAGQGERVRAQARAHRAVARDVALRPDGHGASPEPLQPHARRGCGAPHAQDREHEQHRGQGSRRRGLRARDVELPKVISDAGR